MPELAINIATKYNASGATAAKRDLNALQQASQGVKGAFANLQQSLAGGIQSVGAFGNALLPLSVGLAAIGVSGLKSMAEFSQTMENTRVIVNATEADMAALTQQALDLGAASVFSANEVAAAQRELGKAGLSTNEIMGALPGVLNLAAAGQVDMATAASLTTSALNSFGLEVEESARVADLLAGAANASLADITDLGQGMQQAGFAFAEANWPIEDLATSLAILTDRGLTGSDAGTALKNAWTRMVAPTKEAKGVMDELGISFFTATGNMKSLPEIIDNLNIATAGLTEEQRANLLSTIFLSDGYKALAPLLDEGVAGFNEYKEVVTEAGAAQKVAEANMKGLAGAIEYIMGSIDSAMKAAFLPWEEVIADTIVSIADLVSSVGDLPDPILKAAVAFAAVLAVAGPLAAALPFVAAAFGALLSPIGLVVLAIAGLAAAWAADLGNIREVTASIVGRVRELLSGLWTGITTGNWQPLLNSLAALWADLSAWFAKTKANILEWVKGWWNQFTGTDIDASGFMTGVESLGIKLQIWFAIQKTRIAGWVKEWATGFSDWVSDVWPTLSTNLDALITSLSSWIGAQADVIYANVSAWATEFSDWVVTAWPLLSANLLSLVTSLTGWIGSQAPVIGAKVSEWATGFSDWVASVWPILSANLGLMMVSFAAWIGMQATTIGTQTMKWAGKFAEWVSGVWAVLKPELVTMLKSLTDWIGLQALTIQTKLLTWKGKFTEWAGEIWAGLKPDLDAVLTSLKTWIEEQVPILATLIEGWEDAFADFDPAAAFEGIETTLGDIVTAIDEATAPVRDFVTEFIKVQDVLVAIGVMSAVSAIPGLIGMAAALAAATAAAATLVLTFAALVLAAAAIRTAWETNFADIQGLVGDLGAELGTLYTSAVAAWEEGDWSEVKASLGRLTAILANWTANDLRNALRANEWWREIEEIIYVMGWNIQLRIYQVTKAVADSWNGLVTATVDSWTAISEAIITPLNGIVSATIQGWTTLASAIIAVMIGLQVSLLNAWTFIAANASDKVGAIRDTLAPIWTAIQSAGETAISGIKTALELIGSGATAAQDALQRFRDWLGSLEIPNPFQPLLDAINAVKDALSGGALSGSGGLSTAAPSVSTALSIDDFMPTFDEAISIRLTPDETELMDFLGGLRDSPVQIPIEMEFKKDGPGLKSLIPLDQRTVEVEIEPKAKGGGLISSLKDLIPSLDTLGAEFEIPEPKWLSSLVDWNAEEPGWLQSLITWIAEEPPWQSSLLSWVPDEPPWQSSLLNWIAKTPPWHSPLLNWVAKTPPWVPQLTSWVAPTPGWVPALLSYTLPRPTWWGTEAGYIQKPSWWGSSAGTITNVTRVETVSSGGSGNVRSAARSAGIR